jgi:hypothetical protein
LRRDWKFLPIIVSSCWMEKSLGNIELCAVT